MKKMFLFGLAVLLMTISVPSRAEDFLGVPLMPGGSDPESAPSRVQRTYDLPSARVLEFYRQALAGQADLKFRDRKGETVIEDNGSRPWHRVAITKSDAGPTRVEITKDSWTWIIGTLTLRFIGVFVVLLVLYLSMNAETSLVARWLKRGQKRTEEGAKAPA
ncbi:MAG: hypothetical protein JW821_06205 [Deltaproteobacteria bacterium]|nr:hypothetical protein [Deltaproteobacteria bacterium]